MSKTYLTWDDIQEDTKTLADKLAKFNFSCIVGIANGGMIPATLLAKHFKVNKLLSGVVDAQDVSYVLLANIKRTAAINKAKKGIEESRANRNAKDIYKNRTAEETAKSLVDRNIDDEKFYRELDAEDEEGTVYNPNKPML